jgi:hypothetical protein
MPPAYPNDLAQKVELRWQQRRAVSVPLPAPRNDNAAGGGYCPACDKPARIAPVVSEYRSDGLTHHHWLCTTCSHEWVTAQTVAT